MNAPSVPVPDVPVPDVPAPVPAPGPRLFNSKLYDPENIPLAIRHMQIIRIFPHPKTNVGRFVYLYWAMRLISTNVRVSEYGVFKPMKFKVTLELLLRDTYALVEDREGFDDMYFRQDSCVEQDKMDRIEKILEMSSVPTDSTLLALVIHLLADVSNDWLVKDDYGGRPTPLNRALCSLLIDQVAEYLETGR